MSLKWKTFNSFIKKGIITSLKMWKIITSSHWQWDIIHQPWIKKTTWTEGFCKWPRFEVVCLGSWPSTIMLGLIRRNASITTLPILKAENIHILTMVHFPLLSPFSLLWVCVKITCFNIPTEWFAKVTTPRTVLLRRW